MTISNSVPLAKKKYFGRIREVDFGRSNWISLFGGFDLKEVAIKCVVREIASDPGIHQWIRLDL